MLFIPSSVFLCTTSGVVESSTVMHGFSEDIRRGALSAFNANHKKKYIISITNGSYCVSQYTQTSLVHTSKIMIYKTVITLPF